MDIPNWIVGLAALLTLAIQSGVIISRVTNKINENNIQIRKDFAAELHIRDEKVYKLEIWIRDELKQYALRESVHTAIGRIEQRMVTMNEEIMKSIRHMDTKLDVIRDNANA